MEPQAWVVLGILALTIGLFVSDRLRLDLVALLSLLALFLSGVITTAEGLAGFSNPIVLMIAGLFVVGTGLMNSGVAGWLGEQLGRYGGASERRLLVALMLAAALASAFMSSTGTVAILLPVVVVVGKRAHISPARLLIPLAFSSLVGGMLTLIGTPPNIVVNNELERHGAQVFTFFSYTPAGLVMLALAIGFMVLVGRRLLPGAPKQSEEGPRSITQKELATDYTIPGRLHTARLSPDSPLVGQALRATALRQSHELHVLGLRRANGEACSVKATQLLHAGDRLRIRAEDEAYAAARQKLGLEALPDRGDLMLPPEEALAEVVLPRRSKLIGRTLRACHFRDHYRATVLAVRRAGKALEASVADSTLRHGDTLLIRGIPKYLRTLSDEPHNFVLLSHARPSGEGRIDPKLGPRAIGITLSMLVLMTLGVVPNVVAVLLAAVAMVLGRCLTAVEAYRRISWESVVVIAAILPMATALEKTGAMLAMVNALVASLGSQGPLLMLAVLFIVTSAFSQVISNTATTVLIAPIAYQVASQLGLAPQAFLMTVAIAASTAFATPIASPVNTLVLNAGGYRFGDFFKVGVALQLLLLVATLLVVPLLFPF